MKLVEHMSSDEDVKMFEDIRREITNGCDITVTVGEETVENDELFVLPDKTETTSGKPSLTLWEGNAYFACKIPQDTAEEFCKLHEYARAEGKLYTVTFIAYDDLTGEAYTITTINPYACYPRNGELTVVARFASLLYDHTTIDAMELENELDSEAEQEAHIEQLLAEKKEQEEREKEALGIFSLEDDFVNWNE